MTNTQLKAAQVASLSVAAVATGGTFAAGTYFWKVTASGPWGESGASAEASVAVVLNGSATLTIGAVPAGTHHINVYRGTVTNTENRLIAQLPAGTTTYTDTGTAGVTQTCPATPTFANIALTGTAPAKSIMPAGMPVGVALTLYCGAEQWKASGGAGAGGQRANKMAAAAGFVLQEV